MPLPNLIHPINCTVQHIDRAATHYDADAREPIQHAKRTTTFVLPGQPKWGSEAQLGVSRGGATEDSAGYVLFRQTDLDAAALALEVGDRVTLQGYRSAEVYVTRIQPMGHYPDQNGASLVRAWFTDRRPAKTRRV